MRRKNIFHELKRIVSQFFETEWWYRHRKIKTYWYDDDDKKFHQSSLKARDILTSTWDGEDNILGMALLKIEHMFYNLKKSSWEKYFYVDSPYILKYGSDNDINWAFNQVVTKRTLNREEFLEGINNYESDDHRLYSKFIWSYDKDNNPRMLTVFYDSDTDIKVNFLKYQEVPLSEVFNHKNVIEGVISYAYDVDVPIEKYHELDEKLKPHVRGLRKKLTDLLYLRRLIKKLFYMDEVNDKYFKMWGYIKDEKEQRKKMLESRKLYESDRKKLHTEIAEFMIKNGEFWWD